MPSSRNRHADTHTHTHSRFIPPGSDLSYQVVIQIQVWHCRRREREVEMWRKSGALQDEEMRKVKCEGLEVIRRRH